MRHYKENSKFLIWKTINIGRSHDGFEKWTVIG